MAKEKHVFIDWDEIEAGYGKAWPDWNDGDAPARFMPYGVRIETHIPKLEEKPVIVPDKPWESNRINAYATIFMDNGKYRMWYESLDVERVSDSNSYLCYAESDDGVNWVKPELGLYEYKGSLKNNIVCTNIHGSCVFKDNKASSDKRYKMIWMESTWPLEGEYSKIHAKVSPDGFVWRDLPEPIASIPADTQSVLTYDEEEKEYVIFTRQTYKVEHTLNSHHLFCRRGISRCTGKDFEKIDCHQMLLLNNPCDAVDVDYYTNAYVKWPDARRAHLMFIAMFHRTQDLVDIHLATSRDGKVWNRPLGKQPLIANGPRGSFNDYSMYVADGLVPAGNGKWAIYVHCSNNPHNASEKELILPYGGFWRAIYREDGITSLTADEIGEFYTIPYELEERALKINADIYDNGYIKVAVVDSWTGTEIEGYSMNDAIPITGNVFWQKVCWKGNEKLPPKHKRPLRLHFKMFKARLFAYSFE